MSVNTPIVKLRNLPAIVPTTLAQEKILFIGQKISSGTAVEGELYQGLESNLDYETLAGKNSIAASMIRAAQAIVANSEVKPQFDAIFFEDAAASVASAGNVTFTGTTASADATIYVSIGDSVNHRYKLDVSESDAPTAIGEALKDLINADDTAPVTAVNTAGDVEVTAVNKGTEGDKLSIQVEGNIPGISLSLIKMTGGVGVSVISSVLTTIANIRYQTMQMPATYDVDSLATFLDTRWEPTATGIIKDGALIIVKTDTLANFKSSTTAQNKKVVSIFPNKSTELLPVGVADLYLLGSAHCQMDYVIGAQIAAIRALRLTSGADISDYVDASVDSKDFTGGASISTLPYHNTPLVNVPLADLRNVWSEEEMIELQDAGYANFGNNISNTAVLIGDVLTRYKTNSLGQADVSYKYLNYLDQASIVREYFSVNLKARFNQYRLTTGTVVPNVNMADQGVIEAECIKLYGSLSDLGIMVKGEDARKLFINSLVTTIDEANGKVTIIMINPAVTQLREITGTIRLVFTV